MKWFKTLNIFKWTMVWTSIWTMTMSPVALGQQAKQVTKNEMQTALDQMGLNK
ncbi:hypothetical protein K2P97_02765 [bacterium]|nr:hypothetical protein [bacterium]